MRTISGIGGMRLVAMRELRERGRSKSFIISCVVTLVLVAAALVVPQLLGGEAATHQIGVVGEDNEPIVNAAHDLAIAEAEEGDEPELYETVPYTTLDEAEQALSAGEVDLVLIDGATVLQERTGFSGNGLVDSVQRAAGSVRLQRLVEENGQAAADVIEILSSSPLEVMTLDGEDPEGDIRPVIAYAGLLLMYIAILSYGSWTLTGVTEEKNNRVVEVLLATLRPWQLLGGKVLGIGLLGIGQFVLTIGFAFILVNMTDALDIPRLPLDGLLFLILWFILGFSVYSVSYAAAGSLASRPEDAQSAAFPMTMLAVAGFFVSINALDDPTSRLASVTSFIPFTAPFVVPIRQSLDGIGAVEHVATVIVALFSIVVLVRLSARIYAGGLLRFGRRVKLKEAWRSAEL
ncbi:MAG TPA: ABC transporter permease [Acidimicrobiia bacterium]|nr:ABC transporter permease [Acidimicrobiia bacterium]